MRRAVALLIVLACLVWVGTSQAKPACSSTPCVVSLTAGPSKSTWRSPQKFGAVVLELGVFAGYAEGERLHRRLKDGGCVGIYTQPGLRVTIRVCGKGAVPIRVTAVASQPGTIFTVAYSAH